MWEPAGHRILVEVDEQPDKIGSLFVPIQAKERRAIENVEGVLIAIGINAWKAFDDGTPWAKVGDRIMFAKYGGSTLDVEIDGKVKHCRYLNDEDVVGVWKKGE